MQSAITLHRRPYPSDLSSGEWKILEPLLPTEKPGGRHRGYSMREIINAIQYLIRGGGAWRSLPHDLPHWQSVYHYFRSWKRDGTWLRIHDHLHQEVRKQMGREVQPSAAIIDSQSVKTTEKGGFTVMTGRRRSEGANATFWLIRRDFSSTRSCTRQP
jgi:transposase